VNRNCLFIGITLFILLTSSCITPTSDVVVSPSIKDEGVRRIAVWRLRDGGQMPNSGDIATTAIESALMEKGFGIVSYSMIKDILAVEIGYKEGMALESGMLTVEVLNKLKEDTNADAILLGSVSEAWCNMAWLPPCRMAVSFKIISTTSGELLASASVSDEGFAIEKAALKMARKAAAKIKK